MTNPMPSTPMLVGNRPGIPSKPTEVYRLTPITGVVYSFTIDLPRK